MVISLRHGKGEKCIPKVKDFLTLESIQLFLNRGIGSNQLMPGGFPLLFNRRNRVLGLGNVLSSGGLGVRVNERIDGSKDSV